MAYFYQKPWNGYAQSQTLQREDGDISFDADLTCVCSGVVINVSIKLSGVQAISDELMGGLQPNLHLYNIGA